MRQERLRTGARPHRPLKFVVQVIVARLAWRTDILQDLLSHLFALRLLVRLGSVRVEQGLEHVPLRESEQHGEDDEQQQRADEEEALGVADGRLHLGF